MDDDRSGAQEFASGWRLAARADPDVPPSGPMVVDVDGRRLLLLPYEGGGWWGVDAACRGCSGDLSAAAAAATEARVDCARCGTVHEVDAGGVPVMTVDDEIYVLLEG